MATQSLDLTTVMQKIITKRKGWYATVLVYNAGTGIVSVLQNNGQSFADGIPLSPGDSVNDWWYREDMWVVSDSTATIKYMVNWYEDKQG